MCVERVLAQELRHVGGVMSLLSKYWKGCMCRCVAKLNDCNFGWLGLVVPMVDSVCLVDFGGIGSFS